MWPTFLVNLSAAGPAETKTSDRTCGLTVTPNAIFMNRFYLDDDADDPDDDDEDDDDDDVDDEDDEDRDEDDEDDDEDPDELEDEDGETWQVVSERTRFR